MQDPSQVRAVNAEAHSLEFIARGGDLMLSCSFYRSLSLINSHQFHCIALTLCTHCFR